MFRLRRAHFTGTEATLTQNAAGWRIQINLHEPNHSQITIVGYVMPTLELAKELSGKEIAKYGHVCNDCKDWEQF